MLGDVMSAERLHQQGVVNQLTAAGAADAAAFALAERFVAGPQATLARIKRLLAAAPQNDLATQLVLERESFVESLFSADCGEGIDAFLNKRPAKFA
jgi:enoyl-CoA hydratase/carnithine racemase